MKIVKDLKFEHAHIVRDCHTDRCKYNIHGHSYKVSVELSSAKLDKAGMVVDFGLIKQFIDGPLVDKWDHAMSVSENDLPSLVEAVENFNRRYIITPFNTSAEQMAVYFMKYITEVSIPAICEAYPEYRPNGLICTNVMVQETLSGRAYANSEDIKLARYALDEVTYSPELEYGTD